jgi:Pentapeptide repeats (8 copies)
MGLETPPLSGGGPTADSGGAVPTESRVESAPPVEAQTSGAGAPPSEPSKPAKYEELDAIKKAVDDAASVGGGLWLSYLFVLFYLAVATGAVTHADLFLENPVKLPFLNIELPLLTFFFLAPILFLIVHAYTLVHLVMLTEKAKRFHQALHDSTRNVDAAARERLQWQLPSNIFIQFLVGPPGIRGGAFGVALRVIAWTTLVIAPVLLLLTMQVQFLPFHSTFITWTQRIALIVDLLLLGWLWRKVLSGRELGGPFRASWVWPILGGALGLTVILFSWTVATFPGEPQQEFVTSCSGCRLAGAVRERIFESQVDPTNRRRALPFSNTLVLTGFNVLEALGIDDPDKAKWRDFIFRARGRDLKGARFDFASLPRVDFTGANLQGASLDNAQLDARRSIGCDCRAPRSMTRNFRAPRSMLRSSRGPRLIERCFTAHRSSALCVPTGSWIARSFKGHRSMAPSFRVRRSLVYISKVHR